jgi:hypothetical protein
MMRLPKVEKSSVAEPHLADAALDLAPAPGRLNYSAPALFLGLYSAKFKTVYMYMRIRLLQKE